MTFKRKHPIRSRSEGLQQPLIEGQETETQEAPSALPNIGTSEQKTADAKPLVEEEKLLTHTAGNKKQVFRQLADGSLQLVRTVPLSEGGQPARRRFRLRPIKLKYRPLLKKGRTYTRASGTPGLVYRFWQQNGEWEKQRDPAKENVVTVDDDTARYLETMTDDFEEVFND